LFFYYYFQDFQCKTDKFKNITVVKWYALMLKISK